MRFAGRVLLLLRARSASWPHSPARSSPFGNALGSSSALAAGVWVGLFRALAELTMQAVETAPRPEEMRHQEVLFAQKHSKTAWCRTRKSSDLPRSVFNQAWPGPAGSVATRRQ